MKNTKKRKKKASRQSTQSTQPNTVSVADSSLAQKKSVKKDIRPVSSKKGMDRKAGETSGLPKYLNITAQFLKECKIELKKVKWPTRKELLAATSMVIILALVVAFYLGVIDRILVEIVKRVVG